MAKIVISEDEPDIQELIAFSLRLAGHEVIAASNGQEALDLTQKEHPDLVLLDVRMPCLTGYDVCHKIKADPKISHIPVVFLSAKGQKFEIEQGLAAGADEYLLKPFTPKELCTRVKSILANYEK